MSIHPAWDMSQLNQKKKIRTRERIAFIAFLVLGLALAVVVYIVGFRMPAELPPIEAAAGNEADVVVYDNMRAIVAHTRAFVASVMAFVSVLLVAPNWMELKEWHRYALAILSLALVVLGLVG